MRAIISAAAPSGEPEHSVIGFEDLYEEYFDLVWRNLRRLGVPDPQVDDAVQEVFVVIHRKLADFAHRSSLRTWIFGIVMRVASDQRRALRRKRSDNASRAVHVEVDGLVDASARSADDHVAQREAVALLHRLLEELDDDKRAVLVLAELEQMTIPEIAETLGIKLNAAYARLRTARQAFERALKRERARAPGSHR